MIAILSLVMLNPAAAGTSERVVQDRHTGLAIGGFDPVGYFTDAHPMNGSVDFEASEAGAIWRFRNAGNLARFKERPDVYSPQFGGYDPVDVARGVPRAGRPQLWLIVGQKLYLFADVANRDAFQAQAVRFAREAGARWSQVAATLAQ